jgi:hypothetical protein
VFLLIAGGRGFHFGLQIPDQDTLERSNYSVSSTDHGINQRSILRGYPAAAGQLSAISHQLSVISYNAEVFLLNAGGPGFHS